MLLILGREEREARADPLVSFINSYAAIFLPKKSTATSVIFTCRILFCAQIPVSGVLT